MLIENPSFKLDNAVCDEAFNAIFFPQGEGLSLSALNITVELKSSQPFILSTLTFLQGESDVLPWAYSWHGLMFRSTAEAVRRHPQFKNPQYLVPPEISRSYQKMAGLAFGDARIFQPGWFESQISDPRDSDSLLASFSGIAQRCAPSLAEKLSAFVYRLPPPNKFLAARGAYDFLIPFYFQSESIHARRQ